MMAKPELGWIVPSAEYPPPLTQFGPQAMTMWFCDHTGSKPGFECRKLAREIAVGKYREHVIIGQVDQRCRYLFG